MRYLLDTQALLWYVDGNPRLPSNYRSEISNSDNDVFVSYVSIWEIGMKSSIGKLNLTKNLYSMITEDIVNHFDFLHIELSHIIEAVSLPLHHRDPFDWLLIAQSKIENIPIISSDVALDKYSINRLW